MVSGDKLVDYYLDAKETALNAGFSYEIEWQENVLLSQMTESDLLREAAWVVLNSGMRESVVRAKFPNISDAFYFWESAERIVCNADRCRHLALSIFSHGPKIEAIITIARRIHQESFDSFISRIQQDGVDFIKSLPFMGPITSYHLAKNIGLDVVKPDRHLVRMAAAAGYDSPKHLCEEISQLVGDRLSVVDVVMWRFATLNSGYEALLSTP